MKNKNKDSWKKSFYVLTVVGVLFLVYSLFQPAVAVTPDLNDAVVSDEKIVIDGSSARSVGIGDIANNPNDIDQVQDQANHVAYIGEIINGDSGCYRQDITNTREPFIGFDVAIAKKGTPDEPMYIGVLTNEKQYAGYPFHFKNYHAYFRVDPNINIGEDLEWYSVDMSENPFTQKMVTITFFSGAHYDIDNYWLCGYSDENPYVVPSGFDTVDRWTWETGWSTMYDTDLTFVTYTEGGANNDDPPEINITTSSWVTVSRSLGIFSLLGGVVSGIKFRWF